MYRVIRRSTPFMGEHKVLVVMAVLAVVYCLGAPMAANLLAHFGS